MQNVQTNISGVDKDALLGVLDPVLSAHGFVAVEVTFLRERSGWVLRVSIENPTSTDPGLGVTLEACAEISRDFSHALDVADIVEHAYTLEVASPGIERPLVGAADFLRFQGQAAKVTLSTPAPDGQRVLRGTINSVEPASGDVTMSVDGNEIRFPLSSVKQAHLVFDFGTSATKPRAHGKKKGAKQPAKRADSHE